MRQVTTITGDQLCLFDLGVNMGKLRCERAEILAARRLCARSQVNYRSDFGIFERWCLAAGRCALPAVPDTLSLFVTAQLAEGHKVSTVDRRLAGIRHAHLSSGHTLPALPDCRALLVAVRRKRKERPEGKRALAVSDLVKISRRLGRSVAGVRDRALLVFGLASGLRRSEIVALDLADVQVTVRGVSVRIGFSKADQDGVGRTLGIWPGDRVLTDPVRTMRGWLAVRGSAPGPLFTRVQTGGLVTLQRLRGAAVAEVVHRAVSRVGLDPREYGAHSLRAGLVTAAADSGASDREIMRASGHKSVQVMSRYIRHERAFAARNPLAGAL